MPTRCSPSSLRRTCRLGPLERHHLNQKQAGTPLNTDTLTVVLTASSSSLTLNWSTTAGADSQPNITTAGEFSLCKEGKRKKQPLTWSRIKPNVPWLDLWLRSRSGAISDLRPLRTNLTHGVRWGSTDGCWGRWWEQQRNCSMTT